MGSNAGARIPMRTLLDNHLGVLNPRDYLSTVNLNIPHEAGGNIMCFLRHGVGVFRDRNTHGKLGPRTVHIFDRRSIKLLVLPMDSRETVSNWEALKHSMLTRFCWVPREDAVSDGREVQ